MFFPLPNNKYGEGIELDEYKGTYSLVVSQQADDGKVWKKWCYPQGKGGKDAGPIDKSVPWKITLGDSAEAALEMLHTIAQALECDISGKPNFGQHDQSNGPDLDCPF